MQIQAAIKVENRFNDIFLVLGASLLLGLISLIKIPLPFSPIPIVLTPQAVILLSVLMGRKGVYAVAAYLAEGIAGIPVFAGGNCGLAYFLGPTGGYLVGYLVASCAVALLVERIKDRSSVKLFLAMLAADALIFAFGLFHLAFFVGVENALRLGLYPFIGFNMLKLLAAHQLIKKAS